MATGTETASLLHPEAVAHLPAFITLPGQTDWLMNLVGVFLIVVIVGIGVLFLKLHSLPEHMAHRGQKVQFEIVAVLALISLFTHNHAFWIAGLLLAMIPLPDFSTPLSSMASSLGRIAGRNSEPPPAALPPPAPPQVAAERTEG
jgi:hypothetical protein